MLQRYALFFLSLFIFRSSFAEFKEPQPEVDGIVGYGRQIYLNGVNISGSRGQNLYKVNVYIDPHGHIRISAPQYSVEEQESYHPLLPNEIPQLSKGMNQENVLKELSNMKVKKKKEHLGKPKPILEKDFNVKKMDK